MTRLWNLMRRKVRTQEHQIESLEPSKPLQAQVYGKRTISADISSGYSGTIFGNRLFTGISGN